MSAHTAIQALATLLLATLLLAAVLPAAATTSASAHDGPVLVDVSPDDHDERCCRSGFGSHHLCHATAALPEDDSPRADSPQCPPIRTAQAQLITRPLPPILKPPTFVH